MNARAGWFEVDRAGLARVAGRKTKVFILRELVQNSWDEPSKFISVEVYPPSKPNGLSTIRVTDDSPEGFSDLRHAYTLFAPSAKVSDASKRGRFNFGEKLVLALCSQARIETTKGTILFDRGEKRRRSPKRRDAGSMFEGLLKLTAEERELLVRSARQMIPPADRRTFVNGHEVFPRTPVVEFEHILKTEVARDDGRLEETYRHTKVRVYEVLPGEKASLFEMGIPVVETGDRWHVDIGQKVPLNMERDNVPPNWLADVRAGVANATIDLLTVADANSSWARDAMSHHEISDDSVKRLVSLRFGERAVIHDPSDQEANQKAAAEGYVVVTGSQLSSDEWHKVRAAGAIKPAGQVFPTPKGFHPDGTPLAEIHPEDWTPAMVRFERIAHTIANHVLDMPVVVRITNDQAWGFEGAFGPSGLILNIAKFGGVAGFDLEMKDIPSAHVLEFLIHEYAHCAEGNHLSARYHEALCTIGGGVARLALEDPEAFK